MALRTCAYIVTNVLTAWVTYQLEVEGGVAMGATAVAVLPAMMVARVVGEEVEVTDLAVLMAQPAATAAAVAAAATVAAAVPAKPVETVAVVAAAGAMVARAGVVHKEWSSRARCLSL